MRSTAPAPAAAQPVLLFGAGFSGRARPWSSDRSMAHLTIFDPNRMPSGAVLDAWLGELNDHGFRSVRTGAVTERAARQLEREGFHVAQELVLLCLDMATWTAGGAGRTDRLPPRRFDEAAAVDAAAFPAGWAMDASTIGDTCDATPFHRVRGVCDDTAVRALGAYAVTGRSGRHGFLQRLAVRPDLQRHGMGRRLLDDSVRWLHRWHARQVFVNTQVGNDAALHLYRSCGFVELPEGLRVLERSWA